MSCPAILRKHTHQKQQNSNWGPRPCTQARIRLPCLWGAGASSQTPTRLARQPAALTACCAACHAVPCCAVLQVRIIQKLNLKPLDERIAAMDGAGYNTFLLQNADVFLGAHWGAS